MRAGDIIRQRREELGLSGHELAKLAGVNQGQLSRVETGQLRASGAFCAHVCRVLGLNPLEVYEGELSAAAALPPEDLVREMQTLLIRGRWPQLVREGIVSILRATHPGQWLRFTQELTDLGIPAAKQEAWRRMLDLGDPAPAPSPLEGPRTDHT